MNNNNLKNEKLENDLKGKDIKKMFVSGIVKGLLVTCIVISLVGCKKDNVSTTDKIETTASADKKENKDSNNDTSTDNIISTSGDSEEQVERKGFYEGYIPHYSREDILNLDATDIATKKVDMAELKSNYYFKLDSDINWEIDLDNDGKVERVCCKEYSFYSEIDENNLGKDYALYINEKLYVWGCKDYIKDFYIVDIDYSDNKYEISHSDATFVNFVRVAHGWNNGEFIENVFTWNEYKEINYKDILNVDDIPGYTMVQEITKQLGLIMVFDYYKYNSNDYTYEYVEKEEHDLLPNNFELLSELKVYDKADINSNTSIIEPTSSSNKGVILKKALYLGEDVKWLFVTNEDESKQGWVQFEYKDYLKYINGDRASIYFGVGIDITE